MPRLVGTELEAGRRYCLRVVVRDPETLIVEEGDLTQYPYDAIVNAANSELIPGGGVDGAIHRAGGPAIRNECAAIRKSRGPLPPGEVIVTTAGDLLAKKVIHTVGPVWRGGYADEAILLEKCYRNAVRLADGLGFTTIGFPAISTGVYGYPLESAAQVAIPALLDEVNAARRVCMVSLVLFDRAAFSVFAGEAERSALTRNLEVGLGIS